MLVQPSKVQAGNVTTFTPNVNDVSTNDKTRIPKFRNPRTVLVWLSLGPIILGPSLSSTSRNLVMQKSSFGVLGYGGRRWGSIQSTKAPKHRGVDCEIITPKRGRPQEREAPPGDRGQRARSSRERGPKRETLQRKRPTTERDPLERETQQREAPKRERPPRDRDNPKRKTLKRWTPKSERPPRVRGLLQRDAPQREKARLHWPYREMLTSKRDPQEKDIITSERSPRERR